jgi:mitochondrial enoyl-[acyl-carrier protein] reductase / trans-2-enoyl-CoA reductase
LDRVLLYSTSDLTISLIFSNYVLPFPFTLFPFSSTFSSSFIPTGTWSSHVIASGDSFTKVEGIDSSNTNNDAVALGASAVSPIVSAKLLLDYVTTKSGDSIVQSGADSLIGQAIVQLAVTKGLRSINIARGSPAGGWAAFSEHLQGVGATAVVSEEQAARHTFRRLLADLAPPVLGLNGTGGSSAGIVAKSLAQNSTLVSYGSASASGGRSSALQVPLSLFTHKNLTLKGFSVARALETSAKTARDADVREAVASAVTGRVKLLISREPFTDFKAVLPKALAAVSSGKDNVAQRTVVLTF